MRWIFFLIGSFGRKQVVACQLEDAMPGDWSAAAALAAIAFGVTVYCTATAWFAHRERMAKIQRGIDPDKPVE